MTIDHCLKFIILSHVEVATNLTVIVPLIDSALYIIMITNISNASRMNL